MQGRTTVLDLDLSRANTAPTYYDTDLESPSAILSKLFLFLKKIIFIFDFKDSYADNSGLSVEQSRNLYYQKQSADEISTLVKQINALIVSSLNIHLNLGQNFTLNSSQSFMTLQTISTGSLSDKLVQLVGNAQFEIPSNFTLNATTNSSISLRVCFRPPR